MIITTALLSPASCMILAAVLFSGSLHAENLKKIKIMIPIGSNSYTIGRENGVFLISPDGRRIVMRDSTTGRYLQINEKLYDSGQITYWSNTLAYSEDGTSYAMLCALKNWGFFSEVFWRMRQSFIELGDGSCNRAACSCLTGSPRINLFNYYHSGDRHE